MEMIESWEAVLPPAAEDALDVEGLEEDAGLTDSELSEEDEMREEASDEESIELSEEESSDAAEADDSDDVCAMSTWLRKCRTSRSTRKMTSNTNTPTAVRRRRRQCGAGPFDIRGQSISHPC